MLTRRELVKRGLVAAGSLPLLSKATRSYADDKLPSLRLTPFVDELPRPPVHRLVPSLPGFDPTDPELKDVHQHFDHRVGDEDTSPLLYKVYMRPGYHSFHRDLGQSLIWGYTQSGGDPLQALVPGPTFRFTQITRGTLGKAAAELGTLHEARPVLVRFHNALEPDLRRSGFGFGEPYTTIHLHGVHNPARSDGFPVRLDDIESSPKLKSLFAPFPPGGAFAPGEFFDYYYPNRLSEFTDPLGDGIGEADDIGSTRWYHDHLLDFTGQNIYKGLTGFALYFDEYEPDDEAGNVFLPFAQGGVNLQLPSGAFDIPLVVQDKAFHADGQLFFDPFEHDGFLGNQFVVNGKVQPYLNVDRRKYRFRLLNGSNARVYQLFLSQRANGPTFRFTQIGNEGGLFTRPLRERQSFRFAPAERVEVVIDFADPQFDNLDYVYFENRLQQDDGRRPDDLGKGTLILQFRLSNERPHDPSQLPPDLEADARTRPRAKDAVPADELAAAKRRTFEFDRRHGFWAINGELFDEDNPQAQIPLNTTERWRLVNKSGGWAHPIHVHLEFMHVQSRNGQQPARGLDEQDGNALKDTIFLGPNEEVEVATRYRDFTGPFVFHCHNAEHEDAFMMGIFNVFDPGLKTTGSGPKEVVEQPQVDQKRRGKRNEKRGRRRR